MSFRKDVEATPLLEGKWCPGIQALRAEDKPHIAPDAPGILVPGSVYVDVACQEAEPNANRWGYAIACQHTDRKAEVIYWVEIHTAGDKELKKVLKKLTWLRGWLSGKGALLKSYEREFVWIASGATSFTDFSTQKKQLIDAGLTFVGRRFHIRKKRG
jgi:hypothetical protein